METLDSKVCSRCLVLKSLSSFSVRRDGGVERIKSACRECINKEYSERKLGVYVSRKLERPVVEEGYRYCSYCKKVFKLESFYKNTYWCKDCYRLETQKRRSEYTEEQIQTNRVRRQERNIENGRNLLVRLSRLGISKKKYDDMYEAQNGLCAICYQNETVTRNGKAISLSIDHNRLCCPGTYSCGECVRGLLCGNCNNGIGRFADNPETLSAAAEYILKFRN